MSPKVNPSSQGTGNGTAAAAAGITAVTLARSVHAAGSDVVRIALIGCGGRGTGAAINALSTKAPVRLVAMHDAFRDRLDSSLKAIQARCPDRVDVPEERKFTGLDGYLHAIDAGVDMVLLCGPPGFRPMQFEAAVKAGKHVFMENRWPPMPPVSAASWPPTPKPSAKA